VPGEGVEELLGARLAADDLHRLGEAQGGLDQPLGHELRHHVHVTQNDAVLAVLTGRRLPVAA
jgi:hypothetical protein